MPVRHVPVQRGGRVPPARLCARVQFREHLQQRRHLLKPRVERLEAGRLLLVAARQRRPELIHLVLETPHEASEKHGQRRRRLGYHQLRVGDLDAHPVLPPFVRVLEQEPILGH